MTPWQHKPWPVLQAVPVGLKRLGLSQIVNHLLSLGVTGANQYAVCT